MVNGDSTNELIDEQPPLRIQRRTLLRVGVIGSLAALAVAGMGALARFLYPEDDTPREYVGVPISSLPHRGDAPLDRLFLLPDGSSAKKVYLVNLGPDEGLWQQNDHTPGGLIAFWRKCPHDTCTLAWQPERQWQGNDTNGIGLFNCPCCGSTFTKAGASVFGPTPRSLDTFAIDLYARSVRLHIAKALKGSPPHAPPDPSALVAVPT